MWYFTYEHVKEAPGLYVQWKIMQPFRNSNDMILKNCNCSLVFHEERGWKGTVGAQQNTSCLCSDLIMI